VAPLRIDEARHSICGGELMLRGLRKRENAMKFMILVKSTQDSEAGVMVKRCPKPHKEDCEIEIRQVFEPDDFGAALTPELRAQEERLRTQAASAKPGTAMRQLQK
jgi:hypothetical protein